MCQIPTLEDQHHEGESLGPYIQELPIAFSWTATGPMLTFGREGYMAKRNGIDTDWDHVKVRLEASYVAVVPANSEQEAIKAAYRADPSTESAAM